MNQHFQAGLDQVEVSVDELAGLLAQATQAGALEAAGVTLNKQVLKLSALMGQAPAAIKKDAVVVQRLRRMAITLASCQAHLARQAALTGLAMQTLFPAVRTDTYASAMIGRPGQPYGSAGRRSGEFRVVSA
ncbi:MAG: hypothetical protein PHH58_04855 [Rhodoferax sp.]|nr:hypothetical protein [Rhodoferax sp.]